MNEINHLKIYDDIYEYCTRFHIPIENLLDILEDQKVIPMIRGKATEYIATIVLKKLLNKKNWIVQKLNINAQAGTHDEDISITHSKTGLRLKVEAKNACRASFHIGSSRTIIKEPHFKVKCHKSRSNISLRETTNDRYILGDFDILICNVSNAIFQGKTLGDNLEILRNMEYIDELKKFYNVDSDGELIRKTYDDWRCVFPNQIILEDNSIPRTPSVKLANDEYWFPVTELELKLLPELERIRK